MRPANNIADPNWAVYYRSVYHSCLHHHHHYHRISLMAPLTPPKTTEELLVSFPAEHVLLLTMNRPKQLNAMTPQMQEDLRSVLNWFENEPDLW